MNLRETYPSVAVSFAPTFNSITGLFTWTPQNYDIGSYNVTFNVTDGELWDEETINIEVNPN